MHIFCWQFFVCAMKITFRKSRYKCWVKIPVRNEEENKMHERQYLFHTDQQLFNIQIYCENILIVEGKRAISATSGNVWPHFNHQPWMQIVHKLNRDVEVSEKAHIAIIKCKYVDLKPFFPGQNSFSVARTVAAAGTNVSIGCAGVQESSFVYLVEWVCQVRYRE